MHILHHPVVHHVHHHWSKWLITAGCIISQVLYLIKPEWGAHAAAIAISANMLWIWHG